MPNKQQFTHIMAVQTTCHGYLHTVMLKSLQALPQATSKEEQWPINHCMRSFSVQCPQVWNMVKLTGAMARSSQLDTWSTRHVCRVDSFTSTQESTQHMSQLKSKLHPNLHLASSGGRGILAEQSLCYNTA